MSPAMGEGHTFPSEQQSARRKGRCPWQGPTAPTVLTLATGEGHRDAQTSPNQQLLDGADAWLPTALRRDTAQHPSLGDFHRGLGAGGPQRRGQDPLALPERGCWSPQTRTERGLSETAGAGGSGGGGGERQGEKEQEEERAAKALGSLSRNPRISAQVSRE